MLCSRRTKTLVSTCVILSGMTNIVCLLYVGWITNYVTNGRPKVAESGETERKLEEDSRGETLRIIERLDRLESVVNEHIKGEHNSGLSSHLFAYCNLGNLGTTTLNDGVENSAQEKVLP